VNILLEPTPCGFVKCCIETIRPRSGITPHGFNDCVNLIEIRGRISKISEVWVGQSRGGSGRRMGGVWKGSIRGLGNGRSENAFKIGSDSVSNLFRGCGMSAVWVGEVGDSIFAVTFEYGEVKEICVAFTFDCPTFFRSLNVIHFFSVLKELMLVVELLLKGEILLGGIEHLIR
jgi:hypothetical protein